MQIVKKDFKGGAQMNILTDIRGQGQGIMYGIMGAVMGAIILAAMLPVLNSVVGTIIAGNMDSFSNSATIVMLLGMVGLIVVIMYVYSLIQGFMNPGQGGM